MSGESPEHRGRTPWYVQPKFTTAAVIIGLWGIGLGLMAATPKFAVVGFWVALLGATLLFLLYLPNYVQWARGKYKPSRDRPAKYELVLIAIATAALFAPHLYFHFSSEDAFSPK